ncbi:gastrula zinc finger protein XlCGF46.1 [Anabrus simplex]|uniref:gastrula zinc finger protein XlCGF46.1 n=1 Tax=Anabrus simplex TaxID=316456 RepID=UPI0035A27404
MTEIEHRQGHGGLRSHTLPVTAGFSTEDPTPGTPGIKLRILPAKAARSKKIANSPSEDAPDIAAGGEGARGVSPGEEGRVENIAGKGVDKECDVDSVLSNIFPCLFCAKAFPNRERRRIHEMSDHVGQTPIPPPKMPYQCYACKKRHTKRLHEPKARHEPNARTFHCSICDKSLKAERYLKNHMLTHSSLKNFKCDHCPSTFKYLRNLQAHRKRHSQDSPMNYVAVAGTGPYTCLRCSKQFQSMAAYHVHNARHARHTANIDRPFQCPTCSRRYHSRPDLKRHLLRHAVSQQPSSFHMCLRCGMFYKNKQTLDNHACRFTDDKPYKCSFCGRTFFRSQFLLRHIQNFHKHEKPMDLNTTSTIPEDAGTENSREGFQEAFLAAVNSESLCTLNHEH